MKILVLCAGLGTRLRPHTLSCPKPLLKVAGRPVLSHLLDKLLELEKIPHFSGKLEFIFVIGHLGEQLISYIQSEYVAKGRLRATFVEQPQPLGSAEAAQQARTAVFATDPDPDLLFIYADTLFDTDFNALTSLPAGVDGVISWRKMEDPRHFGVLMVDEVSGYVAKLVEKPQIFISNRALVSPYYFTSACKLYAALDEQMARGQKFNGEFYFTDAVQIMIEQGAKFLPRQISFWLDAGTRESLLQSNRVLLDLSQVPGSPIMRVSGSALIFEPCFIGEGVTLERAIIGPHVSVSEGAIICESVIADSIVEDGAEIRGITLRGSIIGRGAKVQRQVIEGLSLGDYSLI